MFIEVDLDACKCRDKLNKDITIKRTERDASGKETLIILDNCKILAKNYNSLCNKYGGDDNLCCASCK